MIIILLILLTLTVLFNIVTVDNTPKETITPEQYDWIETHPNHWESQCKQFVLYKSQVKDTWVFDRRKKNAPGVISRFKAPLLDCDYDLMTYIINRDSK